jgi:hypothetical protein
VKIWRKRRALSSSTRRSERPVVCTALALALRSAALLLQRCAFRSSASALHCTQNSSPLHFRFASQPSNLLPSCRLTSRRYSVVQSYSGVVWMCAASNTASWRHCRLWHHRHGTYPDSCPPLGVEPVPDWHALLVAGLRGSSGLGVEEGAARRGVNWVVGGIQRRPAPGLGLVLCRMQSAW